MTYEEFEEILKEHAHKVENVYPKLWAKNRSKKVLAQFRFRCCANRKRKRTAITKYVTKSNPK